MCDDDYTMPPMEHVRTMICCGKDYMQGLRARLAAAEEVCEAWLVLGRDDVEGAKDMDDLVAVWAAIHDAQEKNSA